MKNYKNFIAIVLVLGLFSLNSCKDDEANEPTQEELLVDGKWKLTKDESYTNGELTNTYPSESDFFTTFKSNHTGFTENSESGNVETESWTWSLENSVLVIVVNNEPTEMEIVTLSQSQFETSSTQTYNENEYKSISYFTR